MNGLPVAVLTLVALTAPAMARAQEARPPDALAEMDLDQLMNLEVDRVYGASKFLQDVTRAPASVTIVKAAEIDAFGYRTLADVLRAVPGFYATYDRNYTYIGARGFGRPGDFNSRVLVLIDGHRTNNNIYEGGQHGTEFELDLALVDRVEVIRGPSSTLYGASAFFAVVNVITKSPAALRGVEIEAAAGGLGTYEGRVAYGRTFASGVDVALAGSAYGSRQQATLYYPELDSPETNHGISENADDDRNQRLFARVTFKNLAFEAVHARRRKLVPTGAYGTTLSNPDNETIDEHQYVDALYADELGSGLKVVGRAYYDRTAYEGTYVYADAEGTRPQRDFSNGQWLGTELLLTKSLGSKHTLSGGVDYRWNLRQDQWTYFEGQEPRLLDDRRASHVWAVYGQDEFRLHRAFTVNLGVRHDHYSQFGGTTHFRFGGIVTPTTSTSFKALHGSAFRAPSLYEMHYTSLPGGNLLRPETITTDEVIWEQYYGRHVRSAVSAFWYRIDDLIDQQGTLDDDLASPVFANLGQADALGTEAMVEATVNRLSVTVSQTVQRAEDSDVGEVLTNMPKYLTKVGVRASLLHNRLVVAYQGQYVASRYSVTRAVIPAYFHQGLTFTVRWGLERASLTAGINNLTNTRYWDPVGTEFVQDRIEQNGRTAWMKMRWRF